MDTKPSAADVRAAILASTPAARLERIERFVPAVRSHMDTLAPGSDELAAFAVKLDALTESDHFDQGTARRL